MNTNFQFFTAMNTPFLSFDVHLAPLSQVNDGYNDIVCLTAENGGKISMANFLLAMDHGEYFSVDDEDEVHRNLPIDYIKAKTWELKPQIKAPRPI